MTGILTFHLVRKGRFTRAPPILRQAQPWADTDTRTERLMFTVLGGLADVECDLIRTRTAEGRSREGSRKAPFPHTGTAERDHQIKPFVSLPTQLYPLLAGYSCGVAPFSDLLDQLHLRAVGC
jgi:Resolvase, N terminal domain